MTVKNEEVNGKILVSSGISWTLMMEKCLPTSQCFLEFSLKEEIIIQVEEKLEQKVLKRVEGNVKKLLPQFRNEPGKREG